MDLGIHLLREQLFRGEALLLRLGLEELLIDQLIQRLALDLVFLLLQLLQGPLDQRLKILFIQSLPGYDSQGFLGGGCGNALSKARREKEARTREQR